MNWNVITYTQNICLSLQHKSVDLQESPTTFSCSNIILHQRWSNLIWFMNEKLFMFSHCLKFHQIIHYDCVYALTSTSKKDILGFWRITCCKLTLARQIWRHNYVVGHNEYLISTVLESTIPWVYSLLFLFKSTHHSWRYGRNCEWVLFSEQCRIKFVFDLICPLCIAITGRLSGCGTCKSPIRIIQCKNAG